MWGSFDHNPRWPLIASMLPSSCDTRSPSSNPHRIGRVASFDATPNNVDLIQAAARGFLRRREIMDTRFGKAAVLIQSLRVIAP
ncbi:hypothetical protein L207DRAFT_511879 [Hyaloscypha variabilis F]|uniref:Uncharacterized protein n=1 Tax=Hyaloscypha variabilis (strain UAMH 11265 / GT02V1 / F) TaxID=1149755 RepID=A0A2J6RPE7_HYAVF|nr:hypothetical protein L207DRAFT_511879 [Hyaloscypha variabilis F]